jgi:hypothetical protein
VVELEGSKRRRSTACETFSAAMKPVYFTKQEEGRKAAKR